MKKEKKKVTAGTPKEPITGLAGISLIVYLFDKLSTVIYNALVNGFFGYIFTSYSSELSAYQNGYIVSYFKGGSKTRRFLRTIRKYLSMNFETSFILKKIRSSVCNLAFVPLKTYGSFFLSFGIYTVLVYFINMLLPITGAADMDYLYVGIGTCIVALPIYMSSMNLADAVKQSKFTSAIFVDVFGYREESFENSNPKKKTRSGVSVLWGLVAGVLTFIIHPIVILAALLIFAVIALVITTPEIGVLLCLFGLPFFSFASNPTVILTAMVSLTVFSYIIKLIRGKRIFQLELLDFVVAFFLVLTLLSGMITVGGKSSYYSAIISCLLIFGYFLVVNLIRTQQWLHRCILAIVSSGVTVAFIGILQYLLGLSPNGWIDSDYFPDIQGRATSLFENPNYLAAYLALIFPFVLYQALTAKQKKERVLGIISCFAVVICTVFTWCRGAWLAMLICTLIFFLFYSKKTMRLVFCALLAVPFLSFILPHNIVSRFTSIGDITDSSTMYRVYTWKGSTDMIGDYLWGGIGYGTDAFAQVYPEYAYAGIEKAIHSHSLYLQIIISMGIAGIIGFALVVFFYFQKSLEYLKSPISKKSFLICAAAMTAFASLLIMGLFDYVWYNYRIFFLFWVVMALGVACIRIGKREAQRSLIFEDFSDCSAALDIEV